MTTQDWATNPNNPNRPSEYPTPTEARDMLMGFAPLAADPTEGDLDIVPDEEPVELQIVDANFEPLHLVTGREPIDILAARCITCGLTGHCWCDQPCDECDYPPMAPAQQEVG